PLTFDLCYYLREINSTAGPAPFAAAL
ncbi:hypothetical protein LCGC14_2385510, partial [marine sediment metagenome]